jgi:hypothetical protein
MTTTLLSKPKRGRHVAYCLGQQYRERSGWGQPQGLQTTTKASGPHGIFNSRVKPNGVRPSNLCSFHGNRCVDKEGHLGYVQASKGVWTREAGSGQWRYWSTGSIGFDKATANARRMSADAGKNRPFVPEAAVGGRHFHPSYFCMLVRISQNLQNESKMLPAAMLDSYTEEAVERCLVFQVVTPQSAPRFCNTPAHHNAGCLVSADWNARVGY